MTTNEMVEKYGLYLPEGQPYTVGIKYDNMARRDGTIEEIEARKMELLLFLTEQKGRAILAKQEHDRKRDSIEGLSELKTAINKMREWRTELERRFHGEYASCGIGSEKKPEYSIKAMMKEYPRAAAFLRADAYANSKDMEQAEFGRAARESIIEGEDYKQVIEHMEIRWKACYSSRKTYTKKVVNG